MAKTAQHLRTNQAIGRNRIRQSATSQPLKQRPAQTPFSALNSRPIQDTLNTSHIKSYAPKARTAFIAAMTKRAALFGIRESSIPAMGITPVEQKGDLALIGDRVFPASIIRPRAALVKKVERFTTAKS